MIREVVNGLALRLKELYPSFTVYGEAVKQGMKEPCFLIEVVSGNFRKELGNRYRLQVSIALHYFNAKHNERMHEDFQAVAQKINQELDVIAVGGKVCRTGDKESKVLDEVLHLRFEVSVVLFAEELYTLMRGYELRGDLK